MLHVTAGASFGGGNLCLLCCLCGVAGPTKRHPRLQGERSVGKSALIRMLQEVAFAEAYEPTQSTARSALEWTFKSTNEEVHWPGARSRTSIRCLFVIL